MVSAVVPAAPVAVAVPVVAPIPVPVALPAEREGVVAATRLCVADLDDGRVAVLGAGLLDDADAAPAIRVVQGDPPGASGQAATEIMMFVPRKS
jgi:hypothetical protein